MTAGAAIPVEAPPSGLSLAWRHHLAGLAAAWAAILLLFRQDAAKMVTIWFESATFNHCMLVLPLIAWLAWQRQPELGRLAPRAWAPGLLLVAAGAGFWLLGDAGSLGLARHIGLVVMLQGAAIACLGKSVSRGLAFPIFYALFLIPAGEEAVPIMQTVTAEISMALLGLVGVPAHMEGVFISTPNGYFEVAEACSGVRFLVAMIALAFLVANLCFRSWTRRLLFLGASIVIPILANGVRAWATIYVAFRSGSTEIADGFDHIFYGWIFFGMVIALTLGAAWPFFDRKPGDSWFDPRDLQPEGSQAGGARRLARIAAAVVAIAAVAPLWSAAMASTAAAPPADIAMPEVAGWQRVSTSSRRPWAPHFAGADLVRIAQYRNQAGQEIDLAIILFARQAEGRELIAYGQGAAPPGGAWAWTADDSPPPDGKAELLFSHGTIREVLSFYRIGSVLTGSVASVKAQTMKAKLLGGPQHAVALLVSAEAPADGASARPTINSFLSALGPLAPLADRAAGLPEPR